MIDDIITNMMLYAKNACLWALLNSETANPKPKPNLSPNPKVGSGLGL